MNKEIKCHLKTFGHQKVIFIQQMDILQHQCIFHHFSYNTKNFSPDNDLKSKLVENNKKNTKEIFLLVLSLLLHISKVGNHSQG